MLGTPFSVRGTLPLLGMLSGLAFWWSMRAQFLLCLSNYALVSYLGFTVRAADGNEKTPTNVSLADDPVTAMRKFSVADGLKVTPFAHGTID